MAIRN